MVTVVFYNDKREDHSEPWDSEAKAERWLADNGYKQVDKRHWDRVGTLWEAFIHPNA